MNKIKEVIIGIFVMVILFGSLMIGGYNDTHYTTQAQVYQIEGNSILLIDGAGYVWEITDREDLNHIGQDIKIKFFNNTTNYTREDDVIESVKVLP